MAHAGFANQAAITYEAEVSGEGRVEVDVPFTPGSRVVVLVIGHSGSTFDDLSSASQTSLDFWDNPLDDERWNEA